MNPQVAHPIAKWRVRTSRCFLTESSYTCCTCRHDRSALVTCTCTSSTWPCRSSSSVVKASTWDSRLLLASSHAVHSSSSLRLAAAFSDLAASSFSLVYSRSLCTFDIESVSRCCFEPHDARSRSIWFFIVAFAVSAVCSDAASWSVRL